MVRERVQTMENVISIFQVQDEKGQNNLNKDLNKTGIIPTKNPEEWFFSNGNKENKRASANKTKEITKIRKICKIDVTYYVNIRGKRKQEEHSED